MPNTFNYARSYNPTILEVINQESITSPFVVSNVDWLSAKTFHFTQMSVSGFKNDDGSGTWNDGTFNQEDVPFTLEHDRNVRFGVTPRNIDETNKTASVENILNLFTQTQYAPEVDAYAFSKITSEAIKAAGGLIGSHAISYYTKSNVVSEIIKMMGKGNLKHYRKRGSLIGYVASEIMDLLAISTERTLTIEDAKLEDGSVETRITKINGVPLIEVIETDRFKSLFDFSDGFVADADAMDLNILFASVETVKTVPKMDSAYIEPPSASSANKYQVAIAAFWDTFVFPNGKDGKIDSIYVDLTAPTYSASSTYAVGDVVGQANEVYSCKTAITTGEEFNAAKWTKIS